MFEQALAFHQAGRLDEAQRLYQQILAQSPNHAGALHLLGVLCNQRGNFSEAIGLIQRSVSIERNPVAFCNLSATLRDAGKPEEAIRAANEALAIVPNYPEALNNLANATRDIAKRDKSDTRLVEAAEIYRRAVAADPNHLSAIHNLGTTLRDLNLNIEAIAIFNRALALKPDFAGNWHGLALALQKEGRLDEALAAIDRAIALWPQNAEQHCNRGVILEAMSRLEEAIAAYNEALARRPDFADAIMNIGAIRQRQGHAEEGLALLQKADALQPHHARTIRNIAVTLFDLGRFDEALATYRASLQLDPKDSYAHMLYGMALLNSGDFARGWDEYEWRTRQPEFLKANQFPAHDWRNWKRDFKSILLYAEQGLGDAIHFIRYAKILADRGAKTFVYCQEPLLRLFRRSFPAITFVTAGEKLPQVDAILPLMSLPCYFQTTFETIPGETPYLAPDPADVAAFRKIIPPGAFNVGLVWAGNKIHKADHYRSIPFELLAPITSVSDIKFWSLQMGERAVEGQKYFSATNLAPHLTDFASTAAALECLDLLISVDTSVVHLAGALNRPVWTLVQCVPDWRWLRTGDTTPWYPSMKLFRQTQRNAWAPVIDRVRDALVNR